MNKKENHRHYLQTLRRMTSEQRLMKALELSESVRDLLTYGLRKRFPEKNETEIKEIFVKQILKCSNLNY